MNSRKSVRWSAVPVPCLSTLGLKLKGKQGSGPKGVDDLCFHTYGKFSPSPPSTSVPAPQLRGPNSSPETQIPVLWPKSYPKGPNPSLKAQVLAWRPKSQPRGPILILLAQILPVRPKSKTQGSYPSPEIWVSRLGFGPPG